MNKDFNNFLNSFDYLKLSEDTFNEISAKNINEPAEIITYKAIPEITIRMLEKYHNWLNN